MRCLSLLLWLFLVPIIVAVLTVSILNWDSFDAESVKNTRVLITEASYGIGAEIAYQYAQFGAKLVLIAANKSDLYPVAFRCKELGAGKVEILVGDLFYRKVRTTVFRQLKKYSNQLDVVILNHGYFRRKGLWSGNGDDFVALYEDMNLNLFSYVDLVSKCTELLTANGGGRIGILTTMRSRIGIAGAAAESATRFALRGFSSVFRQEMMYLKNNVSVTVCYLGGEIVGQKPQVGDVTPSSSSSPTSVLVDNSDVALAIITSVASGHYELYYPPRGRMIIWLQHLFPKFVDSRFINALADK